MSKTIFTVFNLYQIVSSKPTTWNLDPFTSNVKELINSTENLTQFVSSIVEIMPEFVLMLSQKVLIKLF